MKRGARDRPTLLCRAYRATLVFCVLLLAVDVLAVTDVGLGQKRADKRASMRAAVSASSEPASFALLVIPVDFADNRLPTDWEPAVELGDRLFPLEGESLANFFHVSSGGRLALNVVLAPLIHLPGETADYRDVYPAGVSRTRLLAKSAIEAAAGGLDFRLLDDDGPDRLPGTIDDDGEVDGVLLLHADLGDEIDPENGLIRALSFYLDEPVNRNGIIASAYSVASMHSGIGIWAHETGHLFGLEERYNREMVTPVGEILSRGGLGIFSVMSAGAWGAGGDGSGAALLDAYSAAQLGWCDVRAGSFDPGVVDTLRPRSEGGLPLRVWTRGEATHEYFLLETRGGPGAAPFDAAIPEGQLIVMHIDESLPEAAAESSPYHIRVNLLEADGGNELLYGEDPGGIDDLFPGSLGKTSLAPGTSPSSSGYAGTSEIALTEITSVGDGVILRIADYNTPAVAVDLAFSDVDPEELLFSAIETGLPLALPTAEVTVVAGAEWGAFAGGSLTESFPLMADPDGVWRPLSTVMWSPAAVLADGATSEFSIVVSANGWQSEAIVRSWTWRDDDTALDFDAGWPGAFTIVHEDGDPRTSWFRWSGSGGPTRDGSSVLACVDTSDAEGAMWPATRYENNANVVLLSGPLAETVATVRLVHAFDGWETYGGLARDGAVVEFLAGDGVVHPAQPVGGYGGQVDPVARCALHGRSAFADPAEWSAFGDLRWRIDYVPLPTEAVAPLRLRLRLASNPAYGGLGWFVSDLQALTEPAPAGFDTKWNAAGDSLVWEAPDIDASEWGVDASSDGGIRWNEVWRGLPDDDGGSRKAIPRSRVTATGYTSTGTRYLLRVFAVSSIGEVLSRPAILCGETNGLAQGPLGVPWLDVSAGTVRLMLDLPATAAATLEVFDLRGRRLGRWQELSGKQYFEWDARNDEHRRVAAGTYLFRLRHGAVTTTRKVIVLR